MSRLWAKRMRDCTNTVSNHSANTNTKANTGPNKTGSDTRQYAEPRSDIATIG